MQPDPAFCGRRFPPVPLPFPSFPLPQQALLHAGAGKGTEKYPNGDMYEGGFEDDKRSGQGTYWLNEKGAYRVHYSGQWARSKPHGRGILFCENGDKYDGEFRLGKRHGSGKQTYGGRPKDRLGAAVYQGEWRGDKRHGQGEMVYANGDVYKGEWRDDKKHGRGVYTSKHAKRRMEGLWADDVPVGGEMFSTEKNGGRIPRNDLLDPESVRARLGKDEPLPEEGNTYQPILAYTSSVIDIEQREE